MYPLQLVIALLLLLVGWQPAQADEEEQYFDVKGKVICHKKDLDKMNIYLINTATHDTNTIELISGRFDFLLQYNHKYMLVLRNDTTPVKKVIILTGVPSEASYKMRLSLDVAHKTRNELAIVEYNGFENKFVLKNLVYSELKRRRYELEVFYDMVGDHRLKRR